MRNNGVIWRGRVAYSGGKMLMVFKAKWEQIFARAFLFLKRYRWLGDGRLILVEKTNLIFPVYLKLMTGFPSVHNNFAIPTVVIPS